MSESESENIKKRRYPFPIKPTAKELGKDTFSVESISSESIEEDSSSEGKTQRNSNVNEIEGIRASSKNANKLWHRVKENQNRTYFLLEILFPTAFIFVITPAVNVILKEYDMVCLNLAFDLSLERNCDNFEMNLLFIIFIAFQCDMGHFLFGLELLMKFCTDISRRKTLMTLQTITYWSFKFIFMMKGLVERQITFQMRLVASLSMYLTFYIGCLFFMKRKNTFGLTRNYLMFEVMITSIPIILPTICRYLFPALTKAIANDEISLSILTLLIALTKTVVSTVFRSIVLQSNNYDPDHHITVYPGIMFVEAYLQGFKFASLLQLKSTGYSFIVSTIIVLGVDVILITRLPVLILKKSSRRLSLSPKARKSIQKIENIEITYKVMNGVKLLDFLPLVNVATCLALKCPYTIGSFGFNYANWTYRQLTFNDQLYEYDQIVTFEKLIILIAASLGKSILVLIINYRLKSNCLFFDTSPKTLFRYIISLAYHMKSHFMFLFGMEVCFLTSGVLKLDINILTLFLGFYIWLFRIPA